MRDGLLAMFKQEMTLLCGETYRPTASVHRRASSEMVKSLFARLHARGAKAGTARRLQLVRDGSEAIAKAVRHFRPDAVRQVCLVHVERGLCGRLSWKHQGEVVQRINRLNVPATLSVTFPSTNHIENVMRNSRGTIGKPDLIKDLSIDFKDIARTARVIKLDEPAFDDAPYRHPATNVEIPVTTHADSLLKLLEDATADTPAQLTAKSALRAKFIAYELPADFVQDLRAALAACNSGKQSDNSEGVESTSAIDTLLSAAQAIITRLDAAIQNKYSRDPDKLAAWKSASRTERPAKKQKLDDTTPPPAV